MRPDPTVWWYRAATGLVYVWILMVLTEIRKNLGEFSTRDRVRGAYYFWGCRREAQDDDRTNDLRVD